MSASVPPTVSPAVRALLDELTRPSVRALEAYAIPHPTGIRVKLDANEHPWPLDADLAEEFGRVLARVQLNRYPDGGSRELRELLAQECGAPADQIVVGNGSDELITVLITAFSRARPGATAGRARIAYPWPSFVVYRLASLAQECTPAEIPLREDYTLDEDAVERVISEGGAKPNLIFFALPNNPTGTLWPREAIVRVVKRHPDVLVVSDEAYFDYCGGATLTDLLPAHPNLILMRTLSKVGLAGLRVGYVAAHAAVVQELNKVRPVYNIGSLNQAAAAWLLANHRDRLRAKIATLVAERERVAAALARIDGVRVFPSQANLILIRVGTPGDGAATRLWQTLAERGVLVRSFDRPGPLSGCLRVTIGTPAENDALLVALRP